MGLRVWSIGNTGDAADIPDAHVDTGCILQNPTDSCYFLTLKKYAGCMCYRRGSGSHGHKECNLRRRVKCCHCDSGNHHSSVCAYKFLACTHWDTILEGHPSVHCGTVVHLGFHQLTRWKQRHDNWNFSFQCCKTESFWLICKECVEPDVCIVCIKSELVTHATNCCQCR